MGLVLVMKKIEQIVREEQNKVGAKILSPQFNHDI